MNIDIFKVSKLRIVDIYKLVDKLTDIEKEEAINKYENNMFNFYVHVDYKNGTYILTGNADYFYVCGLKGLSEINVGLEHSKTLVAIENIKMRIKKEILNPMQAAFYYKETIELAGLSQREISQMIDKSQGAISNKLRLLKLPIEVQKELLRDNIKERHGRALLQMENNENFEI